MLLETNGPKFRKAAQEGVAHVGIDAIGGACPVHQVKRAGEREFHGDDTLRFLQGPLFVLFRHREPDPLGTHIDRAGLELFDFLLVRFASGLAFEREEAPLLEVILLAIECGKNAGAEPNHFPFGAQAKVGRPRKSIAGT